MASSEMSEYLSWAFGHNFSPTLSNVLVASIISAKHWEVC